MTGSVKKSLYVVRKAFRNYNQMMLPGSIVEPGNIKWFKTRLKDRVIIEVTAHNFDMWCSYFKNKFGVDITLTNDDTSVNASDGTTSGDTDDTSDGATTGDTDDTSDGTTSGDTDDTSDDKPTLKRVVAVAN